MKRISYETAKLAAKAGYNEPNEVYYCLDQNNNPKIECIIPDEPGIQNSDSVATQVINDFRNNKYEIYKTEIINSDTTYYYRLKQKE